MSTRSWYALAAMLVAFGLTAPHAVAIDVYAAMQETDPSANGQEDSVAPTEGESPELVDAESWVNAPPEIALFTAFASDVRDRSSALVSDRSHADDGVVMTGYCSDCGCYASHCCCAPKRSRPRSFAWAEFLYLHATDVDMAHAQQQNGIGGAGTVPFGDIGTLDPGYSPAVRIGGGCNLDNCNSIVGSVTYLFSADDTDYLEPPVIPGGGGAVGSLVHHPGAAITASVGPVIGEYEIDYILGDLALRRRLWCNRSSRVHGIFGAAYGNLGQDFLQSGVFAGGSAGTIDTWTNIDFDGAGLKFGLDGEWCLAPRLSAYAGGSVTALSGQFDSHYVMHNSTTDVRLAEARWSDDRVVSVLEYEIGFRWTSCNGRWGMSGGYLFSHWNNMVTTPEFIDAVQADNYVDLGDTISFNGFTARVECRF